jgi:hypothetical protein
MGINRGPLIATFLLAAGHRLSADEAWEQVKSRDCLKTRSEASEAANHETDQREIDPRLAGGAGLATPTAAT